MNQKITGTIIIVVGILLAVFVFLAKAKEDTYIKNYIAEQGSCYLADGTCLHDNRDYSLYIGGWVLSASLIILGIYLFLFDRTQAVLAEHQVKVSSALKEAKDKDEFAAFLAGFTSEEQNIIKAIREQDGITQSTLRFRTGMSKTGLSLMLKDLEERKIISRNPSGKTNEIYLRKKF
jgi:DNA-binding MarR family transcriptional regulator